MSIYKAIRGTGVALVTPFQSNGEVHYDNLQKMVDHVIAGGKGVDYIVCLGTTGESATLSKAEKQEVFQCIRLHNKSRVPLVAGIGGNNSHEVLDELAHFNFDGFDAILSVSPYYNKPSQEGIYQHYKAIAEASPVPVIMYNVPPRTASNMLADTTIRLSNDCPNILAVKEASGDLSQCMKIVRYARKDFFTISGEDPLTVPMISFGMQGVISVLANAFPVEFSQMTRLALSGDFTAASSILLRLYEIDKLMYVEGNPVGVKALLSILGIIGPEVRMPLQKATDKLTKDLRAALEQAGFTSH